MSLNKINENYDENYDENYKENENKFIYNNNTANTEILMIFFYFNALIQGKQKKSQRRSASTRYNMHVQVQRTKLVQ